MVGDEGLDFIGEGKGGNVSAGRRIDDEAFVWYYGRRTCMWAERLWQRSCMMQRKQRTKIIVKVRSRSSDSLISDL